MGVKNLPSIVANLLANGRPADTPVAVVRWGTTPKQKTVTGTLASIEDDVRTSGIKAPAIIIVGTVVNLRKTMRWYENRPLFGRRIVVTRAREQASDLIRQLTELGAEAIQCPTIQVKPPRDWTPVDAAIDAIDQYDWLIFTSVNGVDYFFDRLFEKGRDARALGHLKTAAIGPATAKRLETRGLKSDIVPDHYRAEAVVKAFAETDVRGTRILLPRAKEARSVLPVELTGLGAAVDEVTVYETWQAENSGNELVKRLEEGTIDMVTFTSSSTVKNFCKLLPPDAAQRLMKGVTVASIGPITSRTAKESGLTVTIEAESYTIPGLVQAILDYPWQSR